METTVRNILENQEPLFIKDLKITGNDLISEFNLKGKAIGETLDFLLDEVLKDESLNNRENLLLLTRKYINS